LKSLRLKGRRTVGPSGAGCGGEEDKEEVAREAGEKRRTDRSSWSEKRGTLPQRKDRTWPRLRGPLWRAAEGPQNWDFCLVLARQEGREGEVTFGGEVRNGSMDSP